MAAVINTNYLSLVAQNNLNKSQSSLGTAIERLSSGLRINSAKDDAAGMAIANRFTANVKGLTQAARNANDGISLAQTTEGAASEINTHLQRVRELSVQAANGSYSQEQLNSMQDEINQRLSDIDRISQQTDFNGVKVLSGNAKPLTLQVGANDGETITLNLTEISVKTLGLDGFNVNGTGVTQNRTATVSDLQAAGGKAGTGATANDWTVTTNHAAATAEQAFGKLENGNTVVVGGTTYTYDAANGNFTFQNKTADAAALTKLATSLTPATGTTTGTYANNASASTTFEVDATGNLTIGGKAAYLAATGELSTNNPGGGAQATLNDVLTATSKAAVGGASVSIGGKTFNSSGTAGVVTYTDTVAKDALLATFKAGAAGSEINLGQGITAAKLTFTTGTSTDTWVDASGSFTRTQKYDTTYTVDPNTGKATVKSGTGTGDYAPKIGATAYVSASGKLTTETTSKGDKTSDPLKTLDAAFTKLDKLTGELGAVQNRLESTIANLNNVVNNLSSARSRIQDADYATEVSNMSKAQILQQAGTSVLAQANQVPQTVLSLLR
ncbi:flagellin [Achromobacter xylosoxidans]|uniref:flagellin N-terminal helical domain-containing protein n=1 Tax=Alcaligenes xylosoxydans xylosoxydans TaxID=85698 RepID=UPI0006AC57AD|nr:flagellin [Achromobacter xylosoxidans]KOQ18209.1 flagellin [Achromobacter xylosoxidans]KOQ18281.1 flagellin [Achromobacter xylosoxidans]KOQ37183.1 flagellin [Achromobacter xylosoxidans]KOQ42936.1 flagellin [Achromobacter xylosoxidans]KOQ58360.1 flagellin [Achromobacter xylosoxidans]